MSNIIRASQIRQEEKLRQLFAEKAEEKLAVEKSRDKAKAGEELISAANEAAAILEHARAEAQQYISQAEEEMRQAHMAGYEEGYLKGQEEGLEKAMQQVFDELNPFFQNLNREVGLLQMTLDNQVHGLAPRVVRLSIQIAEKIIHRQVKLDPEILLDQVERILREISRVKTLSLRVNPSELDFIKAYEAHFVALTQGIDIIEFVIDHSLAPGGCIIETDSGGVDVSIETQLKMIENTLLEGNRDADA